MSAEDQQIRAFVDEICRQRNSTNWLDRFTTDSVMSGALRLHLDVIDIDAERPTLVFMPGTNAYAVLYGEFLCAVADRGFNIVGFDPRGHGRSGGGRGSYTVSELMSDFRAAIRYARQRFGDPVVVSGSSQGGIVAFYLAAEGYPVAGALCHNLADLGEPASAELTRFPALSRTMKPVILVMARLLPEWKVPVSWYINLVSEPIHELGNSLDLLRRGPLLVPYVRLKSLASLATEPLPCPVEDIQTPVMLLHGEKDVIFPQSYVRSLFERLKCAKRWHLCEGAHHYVLFDEVPRLIGPVCEWLEEVSA
jgi:pimeloyl-ACP methyl ester carboxylesterase